MKMVSLTKLAEYWGITKERVRQLVSEKRIKGVKKIHKRLFLIPLNTPKPKRLKPWGKRRRKNAS